MAKIYEKKEDLEREKLVSKKESYRQNKESLATTGFLSTAVSFASFELDELRKFKASKMGEALPWTKRGGNIIGWAAGALAVISSASFFWFHNKEKEAEKDLDALGVGDVRLPEGAYFEATNSTTPISDMFSCRIKEGRKIETNTRCK